MKAQPNRLTASLDHKFSGDLIDRSRALTFTLDGRVFHGFEGDSVLSAVLANGVDTAGTRFDEPLALNARFAPPVVPAALAHVPERMLPMDRTPAADGMELKTIGSPDAVAKRLMGQLFGSRTLGLIYDHALPMPGAWVDTNAGEEIEADLLVVGGGIAGLTAAYRAMRNRKRVVVVERFQVLGGDAEFHGRSDGEDAPDEAVSKLRSELESRSRVTILTRAEVVSLGRGAARVHQVVNTNAGPEGRVLTVRSEECVIASGAPERLPVFSGNRLPGIAGAISAFRLAQRYGVWPGHDVVFSMSVSPAYRLVMLADEAGISVKRLTDTRLDHYSAYLQYAQVVSIPMAPGLLPVEARTAGRNGDLDVRFAAALDERGEPGEPVRTSRLVIARGAQPDFTLWLQAGGRLRWDGMRHEFVADGEISGLTLAGAAAGYRSFSACRQSGEAAIDVLAGRKPESIIEAEDESSPDSPYESTASFLPVLDGSAYLDWGHSLATRRRGESRRGLLPRSTEDSATGLAKAADTRALSIGDVTARVRLGEIPPGKAGSIIAERCVIAHRIGPETVPDEPAGKLQPEPLAVPAYLAGRFGDRPQRWVVASGDGRRLPIGGLVFARSDLKDPENAIGVVLGDSDKGAGWGVVLIDSVHAGAGDHITIRDISGPADAILEQAYRPK